MNRWLLRPASEPNGRPYVCECHDKDIHGGRFARCRRGAAVELRRTDKRDAPWYRYCYECALAIETKQGSTVERKDR